MTTATTRKTRPAAPTAPAAPLADIFAGSRPLRQAQACLALAKHTLTAITDSDQSLIGEFYWTAADGRDFVGIIELLFPSIPGLPKIKLADIPNPSRLLEPKAQSWAVFLLMRATELVSQALDEDEIDADGNVCWTSRTEQIHGLQTAIENVASLAESETCFVDRKIYEPALAGILRRVE